MRDHPVHMKKAKSGWNTLQEVNGCLMFIETGTTTGPTQ